MAKLKMLKLPKKPKSSASLETKQKWIAKANAIKKENLHRASVNKQSEHASKVIAGISGTFVSPSGFKASILRGSKRRKKATAAPKKRRKVAVSGTHKRRRPAHKKAARKTHRRRR